jgi:hypothetical protein
MSRLPSNVEVDGSYSVDVDCNSMDLDGTVTVDTEEVLDQLNYEDVIDYYKDQGKSDMEDLNGMVQMGMIDTATIIEFLKGEQMRGAFADVNVEKIMEELAR